MTTAPVAETLDLSHRRSTGRSRRTASRTLRDQVSIVLLTYNCGHRLQQVLDKLTALGLPIVAVDNGSTDDTVAVLSQRPSVEVVALGENLGAAARNVGLEHAHTPFVAFCDDDGWYERDGLALAVQALQRHSDLALVNARILVGEKQELDPISVEMAASPLQDEHGMPGAVLLGFMAGAVVVRASAYRSVGGYDTMFFIGGEEETLAMKLAKAGWQMRYLPEVVMHHQPSVANAPQLRAYGLRNTLWNAWLHRRTVSALRWTALVLADHPKTWDWVKGVSMAVVGAPRILRHRKPMSRRLDDQYTELDRRRFAERRPLLNRHDPMRELARRRRSAAG